MDIAKNIYVPLTEGKEKNESWDKQTIDYVLSNKDKVNRFIKKDCSSMGRVQSVDIETIYSDLVNYLYSNEDYNPTDAYNKSSSNTAVSLAGYIFSCCKNCSKKYMTDKYSITKKTISETVEFDGDELPIFDTIPDSKSYDQFENLAYELNDICKSYQSLRYKFGPDIYLIWYIRLLTIAYNKRDKFKELTKLLDASSVRISNGDYEQVMFDIAKAVALIGVDEATKVLEKYVYSAVKIKEAVAKIA